MPHLDVKKAVKLAKDWLAETLKDENISNLGLEEVEFSEAENAWKITLGFSRPWNTQRNALTAITGDIAARRAFRVITVDDVSEEITSMKRRLAGDE